MPNEQEPELPAGTWSFVAFHGYYRVINGEVDDNGLAPIAETKHLAVARLCAAGPQLLDAGTEAAGTMAAAADMFRILNQPRVAAGLMKAHDLLLEAVARGHGFDVQAFLAGAARERST